MKNKRKTLKKKPQGKINHKIVLESLLAGKKKKDIGKEAGSAGKSDEALINAVNRTIKSDEFKAYAEPFIKRLENERERILNAMTARNLDAVEYSDLITGIDKLTKNIELLSGNATDRSIVLVDPQRVKNIKKAIEDL